MAAEPQERIKAWRAAPAEALPYKVSLRVHGAAVCRLHNEALLKEAAHDKDEAHSQMREGVEDLAHEMPALL